jgi:WD40 repeat protein
MKCCLGLLGYARMSISVFLSTVSDEFRAYRDQLRSDLTRHNVEVKVQEDFKGLGGDTLDKLDVYIAHCDAVVHLVGEMTGVSPGRAEQQALLRKYADLPARLPPLDDALRRGAEISYTQWEAWLALYHSKLLLTAKAEPLAPRGPKFAPTDQSREAQSAHLGRLEMVRRYPDCTFESPLDLARHIAYTAILDLLVADYAKYEEHRHYYGQASTRPLLSPIFYDLPSLPDHYQQRDADMAEARAKLLGDSAAVAITSVARATGLQGMGGIGKTVLATALIHDLNIRTAFPDGIVWLTFGRQVQVLAKAAELVFALTGVAASFRTVPEARAQLGLYTASKRLLIVLDDVWEQGAVDPFTGLGGGCRVLITTRDIRVLERARADRHQLDLFDPASARTFLAEATGMACEALPVEAEQIIRECGRLPLGIAAVGALIRRGAFAWTDALAALQQAALRRIDTSWLPDPEQRSLAVVLKLSVDALSEDVRACFLDCAAFREDVDIPEGALLRLWSARVLDELDRKLLAQELVARSLMRRDDQRRYRIHDLYMDYLHHVAVPLADRHKHLIECYRCACPENLANCPDDGYCVQYITWHLREADEIAELRSLLFDLVWMRRKLKVAGVQVLLNDYKLLVEDREASQLAAALELSAHVLGPHPEHLEVQLRGRLVEEDGPAIGRLLANLRRMQPAPFVPIRDRYLTRPGPLLRTIPVSDIVWSVVVMPDGRRALSGSSDRTLQLWDLETAAELRRFEVADTRRSGRLQHRMTMVAVLPDGRHALSGSTNGTLRLWDLDTGDELRQFEGPKDGISTIAVFPDGRQALSVSFNHKLQLWDLETGAELRRFEERGQEVTRLAVLPDGRRVLSGSTDGTLQLWDIDTSAELRRFEGHEGPVSTIAVLSDGRRALSGSDSDGIRLWGLETGTELRRFEGRHLWHRTVATPDGRRMLSSSWNEPLRLWDLETGAELRQFKEAIPFVTTLAVLPDGRRAVSASFDHTLRLWNLETAIELRRLDRHDSMVTTIAALPDGHRALSGSQDHTLRLWNLETGAELWRFEGHRGVVWRVAVLADGRRALSGSFDQTLRLWDLETGAELRRFEGHEQSVSTIAVLPDGGRALSGSDDGTLRLWNLETGAELRRFQGHEKPVSMVVVVPDGRRALSSSNDATLRLWDLETGAELRRFEEPELRDSTIAILPDGRHALWGSYVKPLRLWDLETGAELRRFEEGGQQVTTTLAVMPDGRSVLLGFSDGTLCVSDLETGAELRRFGGHENSVARIKVLPGGRRALSTSPDMTLRLWDLETGAQLECFIGDSTLTVATSPTGDRAIAGDAHGRVMVFALPGLA